jgi:Xaa-Pro aminopeptidase
VRRSLQHNHLHFLAHRMGLVSHEVPHLTCSAPVSYREDDARRPLESGMVISVETTLAHPRRGFIKLEDTVAATDPRLEHRCNGVVNVRFQLGKLIFRLRKNY